MFFFCASHHHESIWSIFIFAAYAGTEQNLSLTTRAKPNKEFVYTPIGVGAAAEQTALIPLIQCCTMFCRRRRCLSLRKKKLLQRGTCCACAAAAFNIPTMHLHAYCARLPYFLFYVMECWKMPASSMLDARAVNSWIMFDYAMMVYLNIKNSYRSARV